MLFYANISTINSNLAPQWGDVSMNVEITINNIGCQWQTFGHICIVYIAGEFKLPQAWTTYLLASNVPGTQFGFKPIGILQSQNDGKAYMISADGKGNLHIASQNMPTEGAWLRGVITYIC